MPLLREVLVYPSIDPQPGFEDLLISLQGDIESFYRGQGHDFYRIRPYEALESARHVDWKASAHVGSLQVREFAREEEQTVEMFLDRDVPAELEEWFEHSIDCCALITKLSMTCSISVKFAYTLRSVSTSTSRAIDEASRSRLRSWTTSVTTRSSSRWLCCFRRWKTKPS